MIDKIPSKPPSEVLPVPRPVDETFDVIRPIKLSNEFWSRLSSAHDNNFNKGVELCKNSTQQDDLAFSLINGIIKAIFEEIKSQTNADDSLSIEDKQKKILQINTLYKNTSGEIDMVKVLDFKLDGLSLQAILHGYTTAFLLLKPNDYQNEY